MEGAGGGEAGTGELGFESRVGELVAVLGVDGVALVEVDAVPGDVDRLGDEALEMHLNAALGGVPADAVGEGGEAEVGVEFAVEAGEDVEVEGSGDTGGVIVGSEDGGEALLAAGREVGAEEEGVAGLKVGAQATENDGGFVGREVADAGTDVEGENAAADGGLGRPALRGDGGVVKGVGLGDVVGELGVDGEAGEGGG